MTIEDLSSAILPKLNEHFGTSAFMHSEHRGELTISVTGDMVLDMLHYLKNEPTLAFDLLKDICAVDWYRRNQRFEVIYNLWSLTHNMRVRVSCFADERDPRVESVCEIYPAANWYERECYDMHGVVFENHPDLRRMYMPEDFVDPISGLALYPLRKDFPAMGIQGSLPLPEK